MDNAHLQLITPPVNKVRADTGMTHGPIVSWLWLPLGFSVPGGSGFLCASILARPKWRRPTANHFMHVRSLKAMPAGTDLPIGYRFFPRKPRTTQQPTTAKPPKDVLIVQGLSVNEPGGSTRQLQSMNRRLRTWVSPGRCCKVE